MKPIIFEENLDLPPKRVLAPKKYVRHSYKLPQWVLSESVQKLEQGQSFFIATKTHKQTVELQRRMAGAIGGSYRKGNPIFGNRYSIRQMPDGVRVWRKK